MASASSPPSPLKCPSPSSSSSVALLFGSDGILKEGNVLVRGHFVWRDRYVQVKKGELLIRRQKKHGTIKANIDLLDRDLGLVFHDDQNLITLSSHGKDTILHYESRTERDAWLSALVAARGDDQEPSIVSSALEEEEEEEASDDMLLVFQDARDSILQCHYSIEKATNDVVLDTQSHNTIETIVSFMETSDVGGRAVLLHLSVIGTSLFDLMLAIAKRSPKSAKLSAFVRDVVFHPVYSKRAECLAADVNQLIDKHFPHCRLRRFSHDLVPDVTIVPEKKRESLLQSAKAWIHPLPAMTRATTTATTSVKKPLQRKRHSFPNILLPTPSMDDLSPPVVERNVSNDSDLFADEMVVEPLRSLLWKHSCADVAAQITIFHARQLTSLRLWDFLHNPRDAAKAIADHFNRLVIYLVWSVLVEDTPKERAEVIESIILIAQDAVQRRNYALVMACVGCLGDSPLMVSRMPLTWKKVRQPFKHDLKDLRALCNHAGGFENLRKKQQTDPKAPLIPFLGVIGVALERLRSTPYVDATTNQLNLDKLERQYHALSVLERAISTLFQRLHRIDALQELLQSLSMEFATPQVLQWRSQQIASSEITPSASSSSSSSSRVSSFQRPFGSTGSVGAADDLTPLLSFRHACSVLASVPVASDRIQIVLEALFADDRQPLTRFLRKFWLDFKRNVFVSAIHVALQGIRQCIESLVRDLLAHKSIEQLLRIMMKPGHHEDELTRLVYARVVTLVTQPILTWTFTKIKHSFATEDERLRSVASSPSTGLVRMVERVSSPIDMLLLLSQMNQQPGESQMALQHPFSTLFLLQQLIDVAMLSTELHSGFQLLESAVARLERKAKEQKRSKSIALTASFRTAAEKSPSIDNECIRSPRTVDDLILGTSTMIGRK